MILPVLICLIMAANRETKSVEGPIEHSLQSVLVFAIDCFKCVSMNGHNKECDDPFHNNFSSAILESPCMGGRKGRDGLFPATSCIKIAGVFLDNKESITVRGCALDSGTLTTDTEIIRMSHCGSFYYEDRYVEGCLQSCSDADGCNKGETFSSGSLPFISGIALIVFSQS